jgi:hypothetical protein
MYIYVYIHNINIYIYIYMYIHNINIYKYVYIRNVFYEFYSKKNQIICSKSKITSLQQSQLNNLCD